MKTLVFGIVLFITCDSFALPRQSFTLQSVSVAFRHGDRTPDVYPAESYPNDPYFNKSFEPIGRGSLTNAGKRREYNLGFQLRKLYDGLISEEYKSSEISVVSTATERTKMSLLLVLASLYVPIESQKWNEDLDWQPIPINALAGGLPNYMYTEICPVYTMELERVKNTDEYKKDLARFDELKKDLTDLTGRNMSDVHHLYKLYLTLMAESSMNLPLPEWTKSYFPDGPINDAALFEYRTQSYTTELKKLNGGLFIRKFLNENLYEKKEKSTKMFLYSMHENNIAAILHTLNLWESQNPPYGSAIIFELYTNEYNKNYIRTLWYKGLLSETEPKTIPGCTEYCLLDDFLRILTDVIPEDTMNSCFGPPENSLLIPQSSNPIVWIYDNINKWFNI